MGLLDQEGMLGDMLLCSPHLHSGIKGTTRSVKGMDVTAA